MSTYQTQGIILKQTDHKNADQLFSIYTQDKGKVSAIGKGTKKITSKLNYQLKPFAVLDLMLAPGRGYQHVAGVQIIEYYPKIKDDLKKIFLVSHIFELADKLTITQQPEPEIFFLLKKFLSAVDTKSEFRAKELIDYRHLFILRMLKIMGLEPKPEISREPKKLNHFLKEYLFEQPVSDKFFKFLTDN